MIEQSTPLLSLEMRHIILYVTKVEVVKEFFIKFMNYKESLRPTLGGNLALEDPNGENTIILAEQAKLPGGIQHAGTKIIINTDDCLRDFHILRHSGVPFLTEPLYKGYGLTADFTDPAGNRYMLLEERFYSNN